MGGSGRGESAKFIFARCSDRLAYLGAALSLKPLHIEHCLAPHPMPEVGNEHFRAARLIAG